MPKFFIHTSQIHNNSIQITGEDVKHISQVLRAKLKDELFICDTETKLNYRTQITKITPDNVICTIIDCKKSGTEPKVQVTIFQGLPKADKMEYIIQKNTEIGAKEIVPVMMERCIVKLDEKDKLKKVDRWQKIAESAAKQSGRNYIPTVAYPIGIKELCGKIAEYDLVLLAYEDEQKITLKQVLKELKNIDNQNIDSKNINNQKKNDQNILDETDNNLATNILGKNENNLKIGVIIGPEGGIDKKELDMLAKAGAKKITLGNRILRTETASVVIMSNIIYEYEM